MMCSKVTERRRRYLTDHGNTFLGLLPAGIAELEIESEDLEVDEKGFLYGPSSSDVVSPEECTSQLS